jgi:hypothetical protein
MDNGPELTANALRDWCRFSSSGSVYIEPGSPWESPFIESFNGKLRDKLLNVELLQRADAHPRCSLASWAVPESEFPFQT